MRAPSALGTLLIATACSGPQVSRTDTLTAGQQQATLTDGAPTSGVRSYQCGDAVLNDQITTGNERLTTFIPCWDMEEEAEHARQNRVPDPEIARARETHRGELAAAELVHCKGIPERELTHSPFSHRRSIAEVIPHRREGEIKGVRIQFRPVPGLTAAWMRKAIACHQARYASLGRPPGYLPEDPTLVEGAEVRVIEHAGAVQVFVTTPEATAGRIAFERANELLHPKAATR